MKKVSISIWECVSTACNTICLGCVCSLPVVRSEHHDQLHLLSQDRLSLREALLSATSWKKWLMSSTSQCKWELVSSIADQSSSHQNQISTVYPSALSIQPRLQWGRDPGWVMGESNWSQPKRCPLLQAPSFSSHTGGAGGNTTVTINCNWRDK